MLVYNNCHFPTVAWVLGNSKCECVQSKARGFFCFLNYFTDNIVMKHE